MRKRVTHCTMSVSQCLSIPPRTRQWHHRVSGSGEIIGNGVGKAEGPQPEAQRAEAGWVLGSGGQPLPQQLGSLEERCKLPIGCRLIVLVYFRCSRWLLLLHFSAHFEHEQQAL